MTVKKGDIMPYHDRDWLYDQYIVKDRTIKSLMDEFGVAHTTIEKFLKRFGIVKRPHVDPPPAEVVCALYVNDGVPANTIASMYPGVGVTTIFKILDENHVERIPNSERVKAWWQNEDNRARMSEVRLELWQDDDYRSKLMESRTDRDVIEAGARKRSARYQGVSLEDWQGYLTPEQTRIRKSKEYLDWRTAVFERDDYRCRCCGDRSAPGNPVTLHAHHLENFAHNEDLRFIVDNGITLCKNCHDIRIEGSFHNLYGIHENTTAQFQEYLATRRSSRQVAQATAGS